MKPFLKSLLFLSIYAILNSCNSATGSLSPSVINTSKSPEQLRQELAMQEHSSPTQYLSVTASIHENQVLIQKADFFHHSKYATDGWIINGSIRSNASIAKFKDATLTINFYSETQTVMETKQATIYKYFMPNQLVPFELKVYPPEGMKNFSVQVATATGVN